MSEHNEICSWCETELTDYEEVWTDVEENPYCCENHLDSGIMVWNAARRIAKVVMENLL